MPEPRPRQVSVEDTPLYSSRWWGKTIQFFNKPVKLAAYFWVGNTGLLPRKQKRMRLTLAGSRSISAAKSPVKHSSNEWEFLPTLAAVNLFQGVDFVDITLLQVTASPPYQ